MSLMIRWAASLYFLTQIWIYRTWKAGRTETWESPHGGVLVAMGFIDAGGEVIWHGYR